MKVTYILICFMLIVLCIQIILQYNEGYNCINSYVERHVFFSLVRLKLSIFGSSTPQSPIRISQKDNRIKYSDELLQSLDKRVVAVSERFYEKAPNVFSRSHSRVALKRLLNHHRTWSRKAQSPPALSNSWMSNHICQYFMVYSRQLPTPVRTRTSTASFLFVFAKPLFSDSLLLSQSTYNCQGLWRSLPRNLQPCKGRVQSDTLTERSELQCNMARILAISKKEIIYCLLYFWNGENICISFPLSYTMLCIYNPIWTSQGIIKLISLKLIRGCMLSHDFIVLLQQSEIYVIGGNLLKRLYPLRTIKTTTKVKMVNQRLLYNNLSPLPLSLLGGGQQDRYNWIAAELQPYIQNNLNSDKYKFIDYILQDQNLANNDEYIYIDVPLTILCKNLSRNSLMKIGNQHHVLTSFRHISKTDIQSKLSIHHCTENCSKFISVFKQVKYKTAIDKMKDYRDKKELVKGNSDYVAWRKKENDRQHTWKVKQKKSTTLLQDKFPPKPLNQKTTKRIIHNFVEDTKYNVFAEKGCAVCGQLTVKTDLVPLQEQKFNKNLLTIPDITRKERKTPTDSIKSLSGPVLASNCSDICLTCLKSLQKNKVPINALANGLWIGDIPDELQNLNWMERLLIARITFNYCIIRVHSSGHYKLKANAICHAIPMPKVYNVLPPKREDLDDVLAFIYIGPSVPNPNEFKRTPFLVRRNKVAIALNWLKLNHIDYYNIDVSYDNLNEYPEDVPPVVIDFQKSTSDTNAEATAVNKNEWDEGTSEGKIPFVMHGLTGTQLSDLIEKNDSSRNLLRTKALEYFKKGGKVLGIGHSDKPESLYDNPHLYPSMFPTLFPYGLGGLGNTRTTYNISDKARKKSLLLYYDKRFAMDEYFSLIAFNHEQIKDSTTGGFLLADRNSFPEIANRINNISEYTLTNLLNRFENEEKVIPITDEEKNCFKLLYDLDYVASHVDGSVTSKKNMRNEIWSLTSFLGAPSWFITFAPADVNHPIALYYAEKNETFFPNFRTHNERVRLIAKNPVAGARFFHFIVQMFIKHLLCFNENMRGVYGDTVGYYGTVEQQGRLTLHMHMLIWIKNNLTPQEIRTRILDPNSDFQQKIVEYLESVHIGEFIDSSMTEMQDTIAKYNAEDPDRNLPTFQLPETPLFKCKQGCKKCSQCIQSEKWWQKYTHTVNELAYRSNVHECHVGCTSKRFPTCKSRMPRQTFKETTVDTETGALHLKKGEAWMNTYTPVVTYLLRCNTDVTSLLSGTAIKSVIAYVTDYITKTPLKTHTVFEAIKSVFIRNSELLASDMNRLQKARKVITKIVNTLTSQSEIGSPMAAMYLLKHPDHYTSHKFRRFFWKQYISEVSNNWNLKEMDTEIDDDDKQPKVVIAHNKDEIVHLSIIHDYIYRPYELKHLNLYDWICFYDKTKQIKTNKKIKKGEWIVQSILNHRWKKSRVEFLVLWDTDEKTWEPYTICSHLSALDEYFKQYKITHWKQLPKLSVITQDSSTTIGFSDTTLTETTLVNDDLDIESNINQCDESDTGDESDTDNESETEFENNIDGNSCSQFISETTLNKKHTTQWYSFLEQHPQHESHKVRLLSMQNSYVPDFAGPKLPRADTGNREDYCKTMLCLFKPWRSGLELKTKHQTWDESFNLHTFNTRQLELMKFFQIRYECNDARDDFSAQRKKGTYLQHMIDDDEIDNLDNEYAYEQIGEPYNPYNKDGNIDFEDYSIKAMRRIQQAIDIEQVLKASGMLDITSPPSNIILPADFNTNALNDHSSYYWQDIIKNKRKQILDARHSNYHKPNSSIEQPLNIVNKDVDRVEIIDRDFLYKTYKPQSTYDSNLLENIIIEFNLNEEQKRAFSIIAHHSISKYPEQLKMFLGGMAGTGKSQVIKALVEFFKQRKENYRFLCMAPTGAAAALIAGSTYHSILGISQYTSNDSVSTIADVRENLTGVEYIFLDEISMVNCHDMYKISRQLAIALNKPNEAFGGINFIVSGDFAQLPPIASGKALYSDTVKSINHTTSSVYEQEAAIGKALWHQFTTVVILRQNMRQKTQSKNDQKFRTLLENLRYKSCTEDDILVLRSLVAGHSLNHNRLNDKNFRNISIITSWNSYRDKINELGSDRFSIESKQDLNTFYSIDKIKPPSIKQGKKRKRNYKDPLRSTNIIGPNFQSLLWDISHASSDHHPGKLKICLGMPVMIKRNKATECSITNGAEGIIVGWTSKKIDDSHRALDILFVKLTANPNPIQFEGLPENIVPITTETINVTCELLDGKKYNIQRTQIPVIPNFAMTDYASQGRTRPFNVVDLQNCKSHHSIYTCLSRGTSFEGTILLQGFDINKLVGGISGRLRQEFRELELLDEITKLRYNNELPSRIDGITRSSIIHTFRIWKGANFVPNSMPNSLKWSENEPFNIDDIIEELEWNIISEKKIKKNKNTQENERSNDTFISAKGTTQLASISTTQALSKSKKAKTTRNTNITSLMPFYGFKWNENTYSCAYDSILLILLHLLRNNNTIWQQYHTQASVYLTEFTKLFTDINIHNNDLEMKRDQVRYLLHQYHPYTFNIDGTQGTDIYKLCYTLLVDNKMFYNNMWCSQCAKCIKITEFRKPYLWQYDNYIWEQGIYSNGSANDQNVATWIEAILNQKSHRRCSTCQTKLYRLIQYDDFPSFIPIIIHSRIKINITNHFKLDGTQYRLCGLIYHGGFHFTCRIVDSNGDLWYNDGITTQRNCRYDGNFQHQNNDFFYTCEGRILSMLIYSRVN